MAKDDKPKDEVDGVPRERDGTRPDFSVPPPRKKLPKSLQETLDSEEKMWDTMYEGRYDYVLSSTAQTRDSEDKGPTEEAAGMANRATTGRRTRLTRISAMLPMHPASVPS